MDAIKTHFLSEFNIRLKSSVAEEHRAWIDALVREHKDNLEFIRKHGKEEWFEEEMKLRLK